MDVHEDIHRVIENYLDVDEFRRYLNSAIQGSRSVTFLLQKQKTRWDNFASWYGPWVELSKKSDIMAWSSSARNKIVHEEDLNTHSQARVTLYGDRFSEADDVYTVPPAYSVEMILADALRHYGPADASTPKTLRIQRKWVDVELPAYELVAALKEVYRFLASLISTAHHESGINSCSLNASSRSCIGGILHPSLPCILPGSPVPDALFDLRSGELTHLSFHRVERDDDLAEVGKGRYGERPNFGNDAIEHAYARLALSKQFLEADGYSGPMLAFVNDKEIRLHAVPFPRDRPRELIIAAAVDAMGAWPYTGAVYSSETWIASPRGRGSLVGVAKSQLKPSNTEYFHADPVGGRDEALIVAAVTAEGKSLSLILPFARTVDGIIYGELQQHASDAVLPIFFKPLLVALREKRKES
jgi:hypothetical protein